MSQDKAAQPVSPASAKSKSSSNSVLIILVVVVLTVLCLPALVGVVLVAAGAFAYLAIETKPAPMRPDMAPMVAPAEMEMPRSVAPEVPPQAEFGPANPQSSRGPN